MTMQGNTAVLLAAKYGTRPGLEVNHITTIIVTTTITPITTTITMTTMIKVLLSCPTVDLDTVDNLGRGLKEMVASSLCFNQNYFTATIGVPLLIFCNISFFQVRDSWRLSTGEKAEVWLNRFYVRFIFLPFFKVEELIETEQRRRRRETLEEGGHLGGSRNNLEEEARELTRLKEQVENKVSRRQNIWNYWTSNCK